VHDIIPEHWIASHGVATPAEGVSQTAYIFPSWRDEVAITTPPQHERKAEQKLPIITRSYKWHGEPVEGAIYPAKDFLKKGNRIPPQAFYCLECGKSCRAGNHGHRINVVRAKGSADLTFSCDEDAVEEIRTRSFPDFQALQRNFEKWLLHQADPVCCLSGLFGKARDRFDKFDYHVGAFWLEVLETSSFAKPANQDALGAPVSIENSDTGPMDSVHLVPGLRLRINWGGVVLIPQGEPNKTSFTRQTITGSSELDLVSRNGTVSLFPTEPRLQDVTAKNFKSISGDATEFGPRNMVGAWFNKLIPAYNDNDLRNLRAFQYLGEGGATPTKLILFTPRFYPKADRVGGDFTAIRSITVPSREEPDSPEDAFLHCPILIGTTKGFRDGSIWPRKRTRGASSEAPQDVSDQSAVDAFGALTGNFSGTFVGQMEVQGLTESLTKLEYFEGSIHEGAGNSPTLLNGRFSGSASGKFEGAFLGKRSGRFTSAGEQNFPEFRAMLFANQTSVQVQVPLTINGIATCPYPELGTNVWNVLETRAQRVFGREDSCTFGSPLLSVTRVRPPEGPTGSKDSPPVGNTGIYRFYCLPRQPLARITITPADSFEIPP
jgi:hypothetical protein